MHLTRYKIYKKCDNTNFWTEAFNRMHVSQNVAFVLLPKPRIFPLINTHGEGEEINKEGKLQTSGLK